MSSYDSLPICCGCGTQYDTLPADKRCRICDDPRQFIPAAGQQWTTLTELRKDCKNVFSKDPLGDDPHIWSIVTEPKFAIGQRCFLLKTPHGNILWDLIAYLDAETVARIKAEGKLVAIVISHPHFYTTHAAWSQAFDCPVYTFSQDQAWFNMPASSPGLDRQLVTSPELQVVQGVHLIRCGGHFDGSAVLHWAEKKALFIADTLWVAASAHSPHPRPPEHPTFAFLWSIPNQLPLGPDAVNGIWQALKHVEFTKVYGLIPAAQCQDDSGFRARLLKSIQLHLRCAGYTAHPLLEEKL